MKITKTAMVRLVSLLSNYMSKDEKFCKSININSLRINFLKASLWPKRNINRTSLLFKKSKDTHKWPSNVPQFTTQPTVGYKLFNPVAKHIHYFSVENKRRH